MRSVPQALLDAMTASRVVNGRLTIRDNRLVFGVPATPNDGAIAGAFSHDSATYNNGILRVANVGGTLYYQWQADPSGSWVAWGTAGSCAANSQPALYGNRLFYQDGGTLYYKDFSGSWGGASSLGSVSGTVAFAPVSATKYYFLDQYSGADTVYGYLHYCDSLGAAANTFPGLLYTGGYVPAFDAERVGSDDYVFFTDFDGKRAMQVRHTYGSFNGSATSAWGDVAPVLPLDILDDTSSFVLGGATILDSKLVLSGLITRSLGTAMHAYLFGPEHYSTGRDFFIGTGGSLGGKLHLIGSSLYYVAPGVLYRADATQLVGVDNASRKLVTSDFSRFSLNYDTNAPARISLDVKSDLTGTLLVPSAEVTVEAGYAGQYANLGIFGIDAAVDGREPEGRTQSLLGRGAGMRRLAQWKADSDFDYWSQGRKAATIADLTDVVRATGRWEEDLVNGGYRLRALNTEGILYSTVRPSRNQLGQAKFFHPGDVGATETTLYGLVLEYYRETKEQAATRLNKPADQILESQYGWSGIAVVARQGVGGGTVEIHTVKNGTWALITSAALVIPAQTWHWLSASFYEGCVRVHYRLDSSSTWTSVIAGQRIADGKLPWGRENTGRVAIYAKNISPSVTSYAFGTDDWLLPVASNAIFPASGTVVVDEEIIAYSGKSFDGYSFAPTNLLITSGYTAPSANWTNIYKVRTWPDAKHELYINGTAGSNWDPDTFDNYALVITSGPGMGTNLKITQVDYIAPDQWVPSQTYTYPDVWTDHIGDPAHGSWTASNMWRIFVEEEVSGLTGPGAHADIRPSLYITGRAQNASVLAPHSQSTCSLYTNGLFVLVEQLKVFTGEVDMSWEWMAEEILKKAGILGVTAEKAVSGTVSTNSMLPVVSAQEREKFVMRFRPISGGQLGVGFNFTDDYQYGYGVTVSATAASYYRANGGAPALVESIPIPSAPAGWLTFSWDGEYASLWANRVLVAAFQCSGASQTGRNCGMISNGAASATVDWPALDMRVDNFILDMGKSGLAILQYLIGQKRIFVQEAVDGTVRLFRSRSDINAQGSPFNLTLLAGFTETDAEMISRVRVQGLEEFEALSASLMAQYGNLFALVNAEELEGEWEIAGEASRILDDARKSGSTTPFQGAADPRLEPQDQIWVDVAGTVKHLQIESVSYDLHLTEREAVFDMDVECRDA